MHLADRISRIIQNEPAIRSAAKTTTRNPLLKPVIGFAIAASVTVVVILGVKQAGMGPAATSAPTVAANHSEPLLIIRWHVLLVSHQYRIKPRATRLAQMPNPG